MATEYDDSSQEHAMSPEDQYRISRLYEEIRARLLEMAMIGARATGLAITDDMVIKFDPNHEAAKQRAYEVDVEIICPGFGPCACIYRGTDGQWHWERECGTTHH